MPLWGRDQVVIRTLNPGGTKTSGADGITTAIVNTELSTAVCYDVSLKVKFPTIPLLQCLISLQNKYKHLSSNFVRTRIECVTPYLFVSGLSAVLGRKRR